MYNGDNLVSIIIPLYNRKELIVETIRSLKSQSYANWEAIIVDDGSTDGSDLLVSKLSEEDSRLKLLHRDREPKGAPTCRNIGIDAAKGEWIIFLDSDDLLAPECLEGRLDAVERGENIDFFVFQGAFFDDGVPDQKTAINNFTKEDDLNRFLRVDIPWLICSCLWKSTHLKDKHYFKEDLITWQDWEFHVMALIKDYKYLKIEGEPDCYVRKHEGDRISGALNDKAIKARLGLFININESLKQCHKDSYNRRICICKAILHTSLLYLNIANDLGSSKWVWGYIHSNRLLPFFQYKIILLYLELYQKANLRRRSRIRKYLINFLSILVPREILKR